MTEEDKLHRFTSVEFTRFKAFKRFRVNLKHFNVLVGPNNSGKSTILAAFRILASALRTANARKPIPIGDSLGYGYNVDLSSISVAEENIFHNYESESGAEITFHLSNRSTLSLVFPADGGCHLIAETQGRRPPSPSIFKRAFNCPIGFVPILGPVEHHEEAYARETARLALFNYRAARNFRNIWYHYPDEFDRFRDMLTETWPGMDILRPELDTSYTPPRLHMFCPEDRFPREIFWAGFGFQVWCQMLTHLVQSSKSSIFLIDEPDIYLHSELQRQLLVILRNLGPDILIATHSTEIITEAETDEILLVNKKVGASRRLKNPSQLSEVFSALGSNTNPLLTQLAKTKKALFVEGKDFQILGKFSRKMGNAEIGNRRKFAVIPVGGFNTERIRSLKDGIETTLGEKISAAVLLDRDYRHNEECDVIESNCSKFCSFIKILRCKEVENFLIVPSAIHRAATRRISDQNRRTGRNTELNLNIEELLFDFIESQKSYITSQYLSKYRVFMRGHSPKTDQSLLDKEILEQLEARWSITEEQKKLVSGKEALGFINKNLQKTCGISVTTTSIIDAMRISEIPEEMKEIVDQLDRF